MVTTNNQAQIQGTKTMRVGVEFILVLQIISPDSPVKDTPVRVLIYLFIFIFGCRVNVL